MRQVKGPAWSLRVAYRLAISMEIGFTRSGEDDLWKER
ncbi:hypothetical protein B4065_0547 [Caldibacillus thermoamylovorans]|uniref:Uncharacterized protein n=1 Tax=Caldibacillus thermoamylovorans TaxID=35841 RepID=A0ABD4A5Z8_9BACI|nr:hypothetical protein B4065_0547 [Caldibacillus thermoamylovorans]KIO70512.1 hypothetical protein B4166_0676 [Caldibacillus thermoamylovorans]KIO72256.1 hypothetical protein B4167_0584 [Caldibacillus thermoamylovorans]